MSAWIKYYLSRKLLRFIPKDKYIWWFRLWGQGEFYWCESPKEDWQDKGVIFEEDTTVGKWIRIEDKEND